MAGRELLLSQRGESHPDEQVSNAGDDAPAEQRSRPRRKTEFDQRKDDRSHACEQSGVREETANRDQCRATASAREDIGQLDLSES